MQSNSKPILRVLGLFLMVALPTLGCVSATPNPPTEAEMPSRSVDRRAAIAEAQRDAAARFGEILNGRVDALALRGMWIVELYRANGSGLRYAISQRDGSIRERNMFQ